MRTSLKSSSRIWVFNSSQNLEIFQDNMDPTLQSGEKQGQLCLQAEIPASFSVPSPFSSFSCAGASGSCLHDKIAQLQTQKVTSSFLSCVFILAMNLQN